MIIENKKPTKKQHLSNLSQPILHNGNIIMPYSLATNYQVEKMRLLTVCSYHSELTIRLNKTHEFTFHEYDKDITLKFTPSGIEFSYEIECVDSLREKIISTSQHSSLPSEQAREKYAEILAEDRVIVSAELSNNKKIFSTIQEKVKFCINNKIEGNIFEKTTYYYVINSENYRVYPDLSISANLDLSFNFTPEVLREMEIYFVENKKPLLAFNILENSSHQTELRQKWIEITVAAELGIKEFYVRKFPSFEILLDEMPSPNLRKMYGTILEHYIGEKSPNLKSIQNGIEMRNSLIHSFADKNIDASMVNQYFKDIKECLIFLQEKLTGMDSFTQNHITFGDLAPIGIYSGKFNLTDNQKVLVASGQCTGSFKSTIY